MCPVINPLIPLLLLAKIKIEKDAEGEFKIDGIKRTEEPTGCACKIHDDQNWKR